jgi:tRNA pseudouridine38-40 synthase
MKRDFFKQKIILYFGYNGKAYHGLQSQKGSEVPTVEGSLYQGLFDSNLVGKSTFGDLHQAGWSRGARTDKGVHALCNSISMKLWITKDLLKEPTIGEDKPC